MFKLFNVTSLAEVWIEMFTAATASRNSSVTSLAEVWIEIYIYYRWYRNCSSH